MKKDKSALYQSEHKLLQDVQTYLNSLRRYSIKVLRINDMYHKGYADLFVCCRGIFVVLELKTVNGPVTPHQNLFLKEMKEAGAVGGVCRCLQDVENYMEEAWERGERCE